MPTDRRFARDLTGRALVELAAEPITVLVSNEVRVFHVLPTEEDALVHQHARIADQVAVIEDCYEEDIGILARYFGGAAGIFFVVPAVAAVLSGFNFRALRSPVGVVQAVAAYRIESGNIFWC